MKKPKMAKLIRVSLVEDDPGVRSNLASMIDGTPGFQCQATYEDGPTALKNIPANRPDVVLMDINLPGMLGTECVRRLKSVAPDVPVLMLTVYDDSEQIFKSLMAGRHGLSAQAHPQGQTARGHPRNHQRRRAHVPADCPARGAILSRGQPECPPHPNARPRWKP